VDERPLCSPEATFSDRVAFKAIPKKSYTAENESEPSDPFLRASSIVVSGSGRAVVCVVGSECSRKPEVFDTTSKTPLQVRLGHLSDAISKYGIYASMLIFLASIVNFLIKCFADSGYKFDNMMNDLSMYVTQFVTIIIVAVPEGIPLTITLSLAYSVSRMRDDGLLIKNLNTPEVNARIDQIIIGKTGTLTKGDNLVVTQFHA
jgi:magnesium-transporting ATPase (P-type)